MYITILIISIIHSQQNLNNPKEKLRGQHRPIFVFSFGECFVEKMLNGYNSVYKRELIHPALFHYLQERGINTDLARSECKELHFIHNGKPYFAIGFPNVAGGYEVRNRYYKDCVAPKDISHIRQQGEPREKCLVFEGMMDYLSFLTLRMKNCPTMPNLDGQDNIILNSVANVSKAIDVLHGYDRIHCLLDNDEAGRNAYWELRREFAERTRDFSDNYNGHKDLNDYLCAKPMFQSAVPMTEKKQVQSARRMIQPPKKKGLKM